MSDPANRPTVGWIGIGDQGGPMAQAIVEAGYPLVVWARNPSKAAGLVEAGAKIVDCVADLGTLCDVIGICVLDDAGVEDLIGTQGLLASLRPSSAILIHSTVSPDLCRRLAALAADRGASILDAPVSGGGAAARAGKLSVMVGGDEEAFDRVTPILRTFGEQIQYVGPAGSAQALKLVNNGLFVSNVWMAWNALAMAERLGVDRTVARNVLTASSGRSLGLDAVDALLTSEWGRHAWSVLNKDVDLLVECVPGASPLTASAKQGATSLSRIAENAE